MTYTLYEGRDVGILFDGERCIHSRNCVLTLPEVFVANGGRDWIKPDNASVEDIIALAKNCPSGAIQYALPSANDREQAPAVNTIRIIENGPLVVHADIKIGEEAPQTRATLCRCGKSKNKPYCDGSHSSEGFEATGEPVSADSETPASRSGELKLNPMPDGPIVFDGPAEFIAGFGRRITCKDRGALCRCGASENKPFCDGSHAKIGFKSDD